MAGPHVSSSQVFVLCNVLKDHSYQCPFCDGLEASGQPVGILGFPSPIHSHYAQAAFQFDDRVVIFLNGGEPGQDEITQKALSVVLARGAVLEKRRIKRLVNNGPEASDGMTVEFEDGDSFKCGCMFHAPGSINRAQHLIDQLGVETTAVGSGLFGMGGEVVLKQFGETSVAGCFAAGDTTALQKSASGAIASGNLAGVGVCHALSTEEGVAAMAKQAPSCP